MAMFKTLKTKIAAHPLLFGGLCLLGGVIGAVGYQRLFPHEKEQAGQQNNQTGGKKKEDSLADLYSRCSPAVPKIEMFPSGSGSGFLLEHRGRYLVVTNKHVLIHAYRGLQLTFYPSRINVGARQGAPLG